MREHSILYDRDEHGEYLHFFTEMLGSRVFFEVVQRVGGYAGFGDPNSAPVRMAAHRERRLITLRDTPAPDDRPPRLLAGPPDRAEPVPARAGGRRRRRRLSVRRSAPDPGHAAGAALPASHRPGPDAHDEGAPGRHRHRGARHRAGPDQPRRESPRLRALPGGRRRARRPSRHHPAARPRPRPQDRPVRRSCASWPGRSASPSTWSSRRGPRRPTSAKPPGSCGGPTNPTPGSWSTCCTSPAPGPAWPTCASCRPSGSTSLTSVTRHPACRHQRGPHPHRPVRAAVPGRRGHRRPRHPRRLPTGIPYALEIPRATLVAQVGAKEHARLAITAARGFLDRSPAQPQPVAGP